MCLSDIPICRVRIGSGEYNHVLFATPFKHHGPEVLMSLKPLAAVVILNLCGIKRYDTARGETQSIGVNSTEEIQPILPIHLGNIIFTQIKLRPSHWTIKPLCAYGGEWRSSA